MCFVTTGSICERDVIVQICIFNAPQRQNFTDKNLALHIVMVVMLSIDVDCIMVFWHVI